MGGSGGTPSQKMLKFSGMHAGAAGHVAQTVRAQHGGKDLKDKHRSSSEYTGNYRKLEF